DPMSQRLPSSSPPAGGLARPARIARPNRFGLTLPQLGQVPVEHPRGLSAPVAAEERMTSTSSAIDADRAVVEATVPRHADGAPAVSEELWALHIAWRRTGSEALQDELFRCYQYLADEAAERLAGDGGHVARLRRAAYEALLTAL